MIGFLIPETGLPRLTVLDCNEVFLREFGFERKKIIGRSIASLLENDSYDTSLHYLYLSMKLGKSGTTVLRLRDEAGTTGAVEVSFFPMKERNENAPPQDNEEAWCWVMREGSTLLRRIPT